MSLTYSDLKSEVKRRAIRDQSGTQYDATIGNLVNSSIFRMGREALWRVLRRMGKLTTVTSYTTGTGAASVTNGSASFSVTGATFLTDGIKIGRRIAFGTDSRVYEIATLTSETAGTLTRVYDGTTSTTTSYEVYPQEEYNLPIQCSHRMFMWHDQFGYPFKMEYFTDQEFRESGVDDTRKGTPVAYRMWGEDMVLAQPASASVMTISSSSSSDVSKSITVFGTVSGYPDYEVITTNASNGTTTTAGSKSFTSIERIVKDSSTVGRITVTANSAAVTVAVLPVGDTTAGILYKKAQLWPLPDDDMTGLTTQGKPTVPEATTASSRLSAKTYAEVFNPSCWAAKSRIPSRFIVNCTAFADGTTCQPSASRATSIVVSIASISGTIWSGRCRSTAARSAAPSSIGKTSRASATCIAGALS